MWILDSELKSKGKILKIFNHQRKWHFLEPLSLEIAQVQVLPLLPCLDNIFICEMALALQRFELFLLAAA